MVLLCTAVTALCTAVYFLCTTGNDTVCCVMLSNASDTAAPVFATTMYYCVLHNVMLCNAINVTIITAV
jgi:hypothetical protein